MAASAALPVKRMPLQLSAVLAMAAVLSCTAAEPLAPRWADVQDHAAVDPDVLEGADYYSAERFPGMDEFVFHPDAGLAAPVRALLMVGHQDGLLPHARYRVAWDVAGDPDAPDSERHYVEVQRFNLGPARREDLRASVPEEHLADASEFGVGPDVAWRFVMAPRRGMRAGVVEASRRELSAGEAAAYDCLGAPCAGLPDPPLPPGTWFERGVGEPSIAYAALPDGPHPARVVEDLVAALGEEAGEILTFRPEASRFVFVVSVNADGQDFATTALGRDSMVMDDEIGTVWAHWRQVPGEVEESALLYQPRGR